MYRFEESYKRVWKTDEDEAYPCLPHENGVFFAANGEEVEMNEACKDISTREVENYSSWRQVGAGSKSSIKEGRLKKGYRYMPKRSVSAHSVQAWYIRE
jgi:hypothetical protein